MYPAYPALNEKAFHIIGASYSILNQGYPSPNQSMAAPLRVSFELEPSDWDEKRKFRRNAPMEFFNFRFFEFAI